MSRHLCGAIPHVLVSNVINYERPVLSNASGYDRERDDVWRLNNAFQRK